MPTPSIRADLSFASFYTVLVVEARPGCLVQGFASTGNPTSGRAARRRRACGMEGSSQPYRGRFLGKPRRAIFRFSHQDAPTPPSPLVGEGGRGDEGQKAWERSKLRIAPKNSTLERSSQPMHQMQHCTANTHADDANEGQEWLGITVGTAESLRLEGPGHPGQTNLMAGRTQLPA